jgi:hypothetical protein
MNRRSFLRGMLGVAALSIVPAPLLSQANIPRIVGDGVHDDTAGIQAALDGQPFICDGCFFVGTQEVHFGASLHRVTKTLIVRRSDTQFVDTRLIVDHQGDAVHLDCVERCVLRNLVVEGRNPFGAGMAFIRILLP